MVGTRCGASAMVNQHGRGAPRPYRIEFVRPTEFFHSSPLLRWGVWPGDILDGCSRLLLHQTSA